MPVQAHLFPAHHEADSLVYTPVIKVYRYTHADLDANHKVAFPVEKGTAVLGVAHLTKVAFDGTSQDLTVGDGTTADLFLAATDLDPDTANDFAYKAASKYFAANSRIVLTFAAAATVGEGELYVLTMGMEK